MILDCAHGEVVRNGYCNDQANNTECIYDGGNCCGPCINAKYCIECECLGNITANNGISNALAGDHGISNGLFANGFCNDAINTPECGLDGFDCCGANVFSDNCTECTCHGNTYRKVASSNTSRLEAHVGFFRLLMKGIFDPYVL